MIIEEDIDEEVEPLTLAAQPVLLLLLFVDFMKDSDDSVWLVDFVLSA